MSRKLTSGARRNTGKPADVYIQLEAPSGEPLRPSVSRANNVPSMSVLKKESDKDAEAKDRLIRRFLRLVNSNLSLTAEGLLRLYQQRSTRKGGFQGTKEVRGAIRRLLAPLRSLVVRGVHLFRDARSIDKDRFLPPSKNTGNMVEMVLTALDAVLINVTVLKDLSVSDLWWLAQNISDIIKYTAERKIAKAEPLVLMELCVDGIFYKAPNSTVDYWQLNFNVLDEDDSGGLSEPQVAHGLEPFLQDLIQLKILKDGSYDEIMDDVLGLMQLVCSDGNDSMDEARDADASEADQDEELGDDLWLSQARYRDLLVHVMVNHTTKVELSKLPQVCLRLKQGVVYRLATGRAGQLSVQEQKKVWGNILREAFADSAFDVIDLSFQEYDQKGHGRVDYEVVRTGLTRLLLPLAQLPQFTMDEYSACLPDEDAVLEKQGDVYTLQRYRTIIMRSLTQLVLSAITQFETPEGILNYELLRKMKRRVQKFAKKWLFAPGSDQLWRVTLGQVMNYRPNTDTNLLDYFTFVIFPKMKHAKEEREIAAHERGQLATVASESGGFDIGSGDESESAMDQDDEEEEEDPDEDHKAKKDDEDDGENYDTKFKMFREGIRHVMDCLCQKGSVLPITTDEVQGMFVRRLSLSNVTIGPDVYEVLRSSQSLGSRGAMLSLMAACLRFLCVRHRKSIEDSNKKGSRQQSNFVSTLWGQCGRAAMEDLNHIPVTSFWVKRLRSFYDDDGFGIEFFRAVRGKKKFMNRKEALETVRALLVPLSMEPFSFSIGNVLNSYKRTLQKQRMNKLDKRAYSEAFVDIWAAVIVERVKTGHAPVVRSKTAANLKKQQTTTWSLMRMFRAVKEGADVRMLHMGSGLHWDNLFQEIKLDLLQTYYDTLRMAKDPRDFAVEVTLTIPVTEVSVDFKFQVDDDSLADFDIFRPAFFKSLRSQVIKALEQFFKGKLDRLNETCSTVTEAINWFAKVKHEFANRLDTGIESLLAASSPEYWFQKFHRLVSNKRNASAFADIFDLEDDNRSGTLRADQAKSTFMNLLSHSWRGSTIQWDDQNKKSISKNIFSHEIAAQVVPQCVHDYLHRTDPDAMDEHLAKVEEDEDQEGADEAVGDKEEQGAVLTEQDQTAELDKADFLALLAQTVGTFVLEAVVRDNGKAWHPQYLEHTVPWVMWHIMEAVTEKLLQDKPSSGTVWIPLVSEQFKKSSTKKALTQFFSMVLVGAKAEQAEDMDESINDKEIEAEQHTYWSEEYLALFAPLSRLEVGREGGALKIIELFDDDDVAIVTPTTKQLAECLLAPDDAKEVELLISLLYALTVDLVVANSALLVATKDELTLSPSILAENIVDMMIQTSRGAVLVSQISPTNQWPTLLRNQMGEHIDSLTEFYSYIDEDLTGMLSLDEMRTGFFLVYKALDLPGFNLEALPTRQDMGLEGEVFGVMHMRKILQGMITEILNNNKAAILSECDELRNNPASDYNLTHRTDEDCELMDWTIKYLVWKLCKTMDDKQTELAVNHSVAIQVLLGIFTVLNLPLVLFFRFSASRMGGKFPFCFKRRSCAGPSCPQRFGNVLFHLFLMWPVLLFTLAIVMGSYYLMFVNIVLYQFLDSAAQSRLATSEVYQPVAFVLLFVVQYLLMHRSKDSPQSVKQKAWELAHLEVNGQMEETYFEGDDRFQLEGPQSFADGLYLKVRAKTEQSAFRRIFQWLSFIVLAAIHVAIPEAYRKWGPEKSPIIGTDLASHVNLYGIVLMNIVVCAPCVVLVNWMLARALAIHSSQATSLRLLSDATDSKLARPEVLLPYYVDIIGHDLNLDCWLYAREVLKQEHKRHGITSIVGPVLVCDLFLLLSVAVNVLFLKDKTVSSFNVLALYDCILMSGWLIMIFVTIANANVTLKDKHLQNLERIKKALVAEISEKVKLMGQTRDMGAASKRRGSFSLHRAVSLPSAIVASKPPLLREKSVGVAPVEEAQSQEESAKDLQQSIEEQRMLHLRIESAMSYIQTVDVGITTLGLVVDQEFLLKVFSVMAAGAGSAFTALLENFSASG